MKICENCGYELNDAASKCHRCDAVVALSEFDKALIKVEELDMKKRFKITIEEEVVEETLTDRGWTVIDQVNGDNKYGNPPQIIQKETVKRTVFTQNTSELDLVAVIKAVNGIE